MDFLSEEFWSQRYRDNEIGWDVGYPSTPIKEYIDQLEDKSLRILVPGCGSGYEAEYLINGGFTNVTVIDLSLEALKRLKERCPEFPEEKMIQGDFLDFNGEFDLILEQTLFCAIDPSLRKNYAESAFNLLVEGGKLAGVMFEFPLDGGPPFGGDREEYAKYFSQYSKAQFEPCYNSIKPREGRELFVIIQK